MRRPSGPVLQRLSLTAAVLIGTVVGATCWTSTASAATPVVDQPSDARAGEVIIVDVAASSTGTLVVTAPTGSVVTNVYGPSGCSGAGTPVVRCGDDTTTWDRSFSVGLTIGSDTPPGSLPGGSVAFTVSGAVVDSAPIPVRVLPPWSADGLRGGTTTVPVAVNGGYFGALSFTAPVGTRITAIANTPTCVIAPDGSSAECGTGLWEGEKDVTLAVDDDAAFGSLPVGEMVFSSSTRSSTPYTVRVLPEAPVVSGIVSPVDDRSSLRGTGRDGARIEVRTADGELLGTTDVAGGRWELPVTVVPGTALRVTQTLAAATSAAAPTTAPLPLPTVTAPEGGVVRPGATLGGAAYPGSAVEVVVDGTTVATVEADTDGRWTATLPASVTEGTHTVSVTARFRSVEAASEVVTITVEAAGTVPPTTPGPTDPPTPPVSPSPSPSAPTTALPVATGGPGGSAGTGSLAFTGTAGGTLVAALVAAGTAVAAGGLLLGRRRRSH